MVRLLSTIVFSLLVTSIAAVDLADLADKDAEVLSLADQLALIDGAGWTKASLVPAKGRKMTGYLQVKGGVTTYKKTKNGDVSKPDLGTYVAVDYGRAKSKSLSAADKHLKKWELAEALPLYEAAIKESGKHPAARLALARCVAIKEAYDVVRGRLTPGKENATRSSYLTDLATLITVTGSGKGDEELGAGIKQAWHEQVASLDEAGRARFQELGKKVGLTLSWSPEAGSWLTQARNTLASGDTTAAAKLFEDAYDGHARFTDEDYVAMVKAMLAVGNKKRAAKILKELPLAVRRRPDVDPLMEQAGVPRGFGTFAFRGNHTGIFPDAVPVTSWSKGGDNWVWTCKLANGRSNASAVVNGNKIFCMEEPNSLVCIDRKSGRVVWKKTNSLADAGKSGSKPHSPSWISTYGWTCMTPVSEGNRVWVALGNGVVACYDLDGNRQWIHAVAVSGRHHGSSASPCLIDGYLVTYTTSGSNGNYYGWDAESGRQLWSDRCAITQGGIVPVKIDGTACALSSGGVLYEAKSGRRIFDHKACFKDKKYGNNWGSTVVVDGDMAYFNNHYENTSKTGMLAVRLTGSDAPAVHWWTPTGGRIGASHLVHNGLIYVDRGQCIDQQSGKMVYNNGSPKCNYSSLVMAADHIYAFNKSKVTIYKPGTSYQQIASFNHGFEDFIASAVFDGPRFYMRDKHGLHCIGR